MYDTQAIQVNPLPPSPKKIFFIYLFLSFVSVMPYFLGAVYVVYLM